MGVGIAIALVWFIIEMLLWYLIAQFISGWWVFGWFVLAFFMGLIFIKKGASVLAPLATQAKSGNMASLSAFMTKQDVLMQALATSMAGVLLLIPGILSDLAALLVLMPPVQKKIKAVGTQYAMKNQEKMMAMMTGQMPRQSPFGAMGNMGGQNPFGSMGASAGKANKGNVIDGNAKIKTPANDD